MKKIVYNDRDRRQFWENLWQFVGPDPDKVDISTYPFYPAVNFIKKDGLILECGCGPGRVVRFFKKKNFDILGLEWSEVALKNLKRIDPDVKITCADVARIPFVDKAFKYVCSFGVYGSFEKKEQREKVLSELRRVLRDDGMLILSVASYNILYYILYGLKQNNFLRRLFGKKVLPHYFGWYQFHKKEIKNELEGAGFDVKNMVFAKTNQLFYDLFPFFRKSIVNFDRRDALKLERGGENVYPLNRIGKLVFSFINKRFPYLIATVVVSIALKK